MDNRLSYIATHKDFKLPSFVDDSYRIVANTELKDEYDIPVIYCDNPLVPMKNSYSEGLMIYQVFIDLIDKEDGWIGFNHYRRYLPQYEATILPTPICTNVHKQFEKHHNINDLIELENIIDWKFPELSFNWNNWEKMYPCNMFVMKKSDFDDYCTFVLSILGEFNDNHHLFTDKEVRAYVEKNKENYSKFDLDYQSRLHGFLMERLSSIFFINQFNNQGIITHKINMIK